MHKKQVINLVKKLTAGVLAVGMVVAGIIAYPKQADAENTVKIPEKVIYELYSENEIAKYRTETGNKAPVKPGYVFGGWFSEADQDTLRAEREADTDNYYAPLTTVEGAAYAKFVPAQVLSVKADNSAGIDEETIESISKENPMYVRVMSSLDSSNYNKVGFDIYLGNWIKVYADEEAQTPTETTKIYQGVMGCKDGQNEQVPISAQEIFGGVSQYVSVWKLAAIDTPSNANLKIYVRPYWVTMDGTKVEGLAKYVHIEDAYMGYVNVPVNFLNKDDMAKIAAGAVNMTYTNANANETVALTFKEVEEGRILPEMQAAQSGNVIKMVGNAKTVYGEYQDETLYANVRFIKPTEDTDVDVNFAMEMVQFCDWDEEDVTIEQKWDVKYDVKETTSE